ncbi:ANTAR domain-containing protein [Lichenibacterium ramalinae]|uniref:ANTAR domain-containing protein n=1 Tax=Lichenibacterium ramalinae TaxID=2316527 RepID=A0A4Q2RJM1_9HYPH|nr:ANTAR domain-containing protein [Lichenibacterium ramalinae]RYB06638.1 ANTAR domain-containing protein [Lichenibacterium ramalinae]
MTERRLIQNFRGMRAILWAGPDFAPDTLDRTLARLGVETARMEEVDLAGLDRDRDVLFIDGDQPLAPEVVLAPGSALPLVPGIGIVGIEAPSRLKLLTEAGVTALLRKPVHAATVYSALFLGVNNFRRLRAMETRLAEGERRRNGRRFVIKAVVALVRGQGLDDDEAYARLRRESMRRRLELEEFCEALLLEGGGTIPAGWPTVSREPMDHRHATYPDDDGRRDGVADADGGPCGGPDQARRA